MKPVDLDTQALDNHLTQDGTVPLLLDLWAPWCGPCKAQAPALDKLAGAGRGSLLVGKVDVDQNAGIRERFGVRGIPTLILFKGGKESSRRTGVQTLAGLRKWMADEGVTLGATAVSAGGETGQPPLGGAFYGDTELRVFLMGRTQQDADTGALQTTRFPSWAQGKGSVMGSLARSPSPEVFERVTGLPAPFGFCMEVAGITDSLTIQRIQSLLPAGADMRNVPVRFVQRWLGDSQLDWKGLLGNDVDRIRTLWLDACNQLMSGTAPAGETWSAVRDLADKVDGKDPMQTVQHHFAEMVKALSPLPDVDEGSNWGVALPMMGNFVTFALAASAQGWTALEFSREMVLHKWMKANCPDPRSKTRDEMAALHAQFRAEHAELLTIVEPKERHFNENRPSLMQPVYARLQEHLFAVMPSNS